MAGEKHVPSAGGVQPIAELLNLLGGTQTKTTTTGDTGVLNQTVNDLNGLDPNALLQAVFQQAQGQMPALLAARSNAVGARSSRNAPAGAALDKLLQDTTIKAQGQITEQQLRAAQIKGQAGAAIAGANRSQTQQQGTNLQKAGQLVAIGSGLNKLYESPLGKKVVGKAGNLFDQLTGDGAGDPLSDLGSADFSSLTDSISFADTPVDSFNLMDGIADIGSSIDFGADIAGNMLTDPYSFAEIGSDAALDAGMSLFADGGMVGRDGKKQMNQQEREAKAKSLSQKMYQRDDKGELYYAAPNDGTSLNFQQGMQMVFPMLMDQLMMQFKQDDMRQLMNPTPQELRGLIRSPSKNMHEGLMLADGGEVSTEQPAAKTGQVRSGGGRASSRPTFTLEQILPTTALQGYTPLTPQRIRNELLVPPQDTFGNAENAENASPEGGFQGLAGLAAALGTPGVSTAIGLATGVPGLGTALGLAAQGLANAEQAHNQQAFNDEALAFANAHEAVGGLGAAGTSEAGMHGDAVGNSGANNGGLAGMGIGLGLGSDSLGSIGNGAGESGGSSGGASGGESGGGDGGHGGGSAGGGAGGEAGGSNWEHGGEVDGPGTGTSDSIKANISDGEYVIPADVVQKLGVGFFDRIRSMFHTPAAMQKMMK